MKSNIYRLVATIALTCTLCGCQTVKPESATEWMQRQPWDTLP